MFSLIAFGFKLALGIVAFVIALILAAFLFD